MLGIELLALESGSGARWDLSGPNRVELGPELLEVGPEMMGSPSSSGVQVFRPSVALCRPSFVPTWASSGCLLEHGPTDLDGRGGDPGRVRQHGSVRFGLGIGRDRQKGGQKRALVLV